MNHLRLEKKGLRGLAIAESFRETDLKSKLAGIVMRRDFVIDGFVFGNATIEGDYATDTMISMYDKLNRNDISFILISGLIISLYNIVDMTKLWKKIKIPIIGVTYEKSDGMEEAIRRHFPNSYESKIIQYQNLGTRTKISLHTQHDIYLRVEGCDMKEAKKLLNAFTLQGAIPEPLRVAQILAKAGLDLTS
ncbi:MAG: DUF99 family protein [Nitrosotalea sp.]